MILERGAGSSAEQGGATMEQGGVAMRKPYVPLIGTKSSESLWRDLWTLQRITLSFLPCQLTDC